MRFTISLAFFLLPVVFLFSSSASPANHRHDDGDPSLSGSIIFHTVGRSNFNFDIYTLPLSNQHSPSANPKELKITDGISVNFNGYFPNPSSSPFSLLSQHQKQTHTLLKKPSSPPSTELVYVTERNGTSTIYYNALFNYDHEPSLTQLKTRSALQVSTTTRIQIPLLVAHPVGRLSMKDKPSLVGESLIYVSTHQPTGVLGQSWAAVYSTNLRTRSTRRLTPIGMADFSPSVSPSGYWTAVTSFGERRWGGEVQELYTDIYVFSTQDGSQRVKVVEHGGWPCWIDDHTIYFHRRSKEDGWWSVYRAILPRVGWVHVESVVVERVTPPGLHAFTPATSPGNKDFIAVATRRADSDYRHIELFDLLTNEFKEVTRPIAPEIHHYNPFLSADSTRIGYHKCRGESKKRNSDYLFLENRRSPIQDISLFRLDAAFPSFSPTGDRIAYTKLPGLNVMDADGSNKREVFKGMAFSTAWDPVRKGVVYTSGGPIFASESTEVDIYSVNVDDENLSYKKLTEGGKNNAFPSISPDGKWIVFRSGRSGHKNLYIMDAVEGERGGIRRLTEGPWTDTMCNWSPIGDWIAFSSDREDPGGRSFELYLIHPSGTGLRKVFQNAEGTRANHPWFSPDGKSIVFTADFAAVSAEPISYPHQYQPYGDIYVANLDGTGIQRMTHSGYEDGTPTWGPRIMRPVDMPQPIEGPGCNFDDCHWLNVNSQRSAKATYMVPTKIRCV
ncbi:hypothetical protein Ancab_038337 [Ancistrocladus abbreviatus]